MQISSLGMEPADGCGDFTPGHVVYLVQISFDRSHTLGIEAGTIEAKCIELFHFGGDTTGLLIFRYQFCHQIVHLFFTQLGQAVE